MVVVCPPPSMFMPRPTIDVVVSNGDGSGAPCYYALEDSEELLITATSSGDLILEVVEEDDDDEEEESAVDAGDEPCWDPLQHIDELPLRPMSPLRKVCIDVVFVVFLVLTVAMEAGLARAALHDGGATAWLIGLPLMLPFMLGFLYLAVLMYLVATRDFDGVWSIKKESSKLTAK